MIVATRTDKKTKVSSKKENCTFWRMESPERESSKQTWGTKKYLKVAEPLIYGVYVIQVERRELAALLSIGCIPVADLNRSLWCQMTEVTITPDKVTGIPRVLVFAAPSSDNLKLLLYLDSGKSYFETIKLD